MASLNYWGRGTIWSSGRQYCLQRVPHVPRAGTFGAIGLLLGITPFTWVALVWAAHTGVDRAVSYGLKYPTGFNLVEEAFSASIRAGVPNTRDSYLTGSRLLSILVSRRFASFFDGVCQFGVVDLLLEVGESSIEFVAGNGVLFGLS